MKVLVIALLLCFVGTTLCEKSKTCLGCAQKVSPDAADVKYLLNKTVSKQNAQSNDEPIKVVTVTEATRQVVAGLKYEVKFAAEGKNSKTKYECQTSFVLAPWKSLEPQVLEYKCTFGGY